MDIQSKLRLRKDDVQHVLMLLLILLACFLLWKLQTVTTLYNAMIDNRYCFVIPELLR